MLQADSFTVIIDCWRVVWTWYHYSIDIFCETERGNTLALFLAFSLLSLLPSFNMYIELKFQQLFDRWGSHSTVYLKINFALASATGYVIGEKEWRNKIMSSLMYMPRLSDLCNYRNEEICNVLKINGLHLAKMKTYIPHMWLPWNL